MRAKVIGVLKPFLAFTSSLQPSTTHNMLIFMFDSWFNNLQFIHDFVGIELAMQVVVEYDHEILLLMLLIVYNNLTLTSIHVEPTWSITLELGVFGALASIEEATLGFLKAEMSLFKKTIMFTTVFNPFTWWVEYEYQFLNISHLVQ